MAEEFERSKKLNELSEAWSSFMKWSVGLKTSRKINFVLQDNFQIENQTELNLGSWKPVATFPFQLIQQQELYNF